MIHKRHRVVGVGERWTDWRKLAGRGIMYTHVLHATLLLSGCARWPSSPDAQCRSHWSPAWERTKMWLSPRFGWNDSADNVTLFREAWLEACTCRWCWSCCARSRWCCRCSACPAGPAAACWSCCQTCWWWPRSLRPPAPCPHPPLGTEPEEHTVLLFLFITTWFFRLHAVCACLHLCPLLYPSVKSCLFHSSILFNSTLIIPLLSFCFIQFFYSVCLTPFHFI